MQLASSRASILPTNTNMRNAPIQKLATISAVLVNGAASRLVGIAGYTLSSLSLNNTPTAGVVTSNHNVESRPCAVARVALTVKCTKMYK